MRALLSIFAIWLCYTAAAQNESFDIISYSAPAGWKAEKKEDVVIYSKTDNRKKTWCRIGIYGSVASKGSADEDFKTIWNEIAVIKYKAYGLKTNDIIQNGEWLIKSGAGNFTFNNSPASFFLTTMTGQKLCISLIATTNSPEYVKDIQNLIGSIQLKTSLLDQSKNKDAGISGHNESTQVNTSKYQLTPTQFDDGWISTAKENWVEVAKPGIKVLIHYPNQKADLHNFNKLDGDNNAWNVLVAPKYSVIRNFYERGIQDYHSITFLTADATDKYSGKQVHVVFFKKHYDNGNGRYLEVVADNQQVFEQEFGRNYINRSSWDYLEQSKSWDKLANMQWRNKFVINNNSLLGKWNSGTYASLSYYYVNSGGFAGATATSIADAFTFLPGNKYESDHAGASGVVGNQKFSRQVYKGNTTIDNWSITLSNRFQGATEKYDCYFEAVKGGRILMMTDRVGTTLSLVRSK